MTDPVPQTNVPVLRAIEQQLNTIRMRLEDAFGHLKVAHDASVICIAASKQTSTDCDEEVATVLFHVVSYRVDTQMRIISTIVEELGGKTEYTEGREKLQDLFEKVNGQGKYAVNNQTSEGQHE